MNFINPVDSFSMSPPPIPSDALRLLRSLDYGKLGDGNAVAGLTVLTSMCATLADVAGPQAAVVFQDGSYPVGINFLTTGSLASEQVASRVLDPLSMLQNILSQNAMHAAAKSAHHMIKKSDTTVGPAKSPITPEHLATTKDSMLLDLLKPTDFDPFGNAGDYQSGAAKLLQRKAFSGVAEVLQRPGFYFEGLNPKLLSSQLVHCHMHHPLVRVSIADLSELSRLEGTCLGIMDGCSLPGNVPIHVKGYVVARMSPEVLKRFVESRDDSSWPYRTLWLVEDPLGPLPRRVANPARLDCVQERYTAALESLLANRLGESPPTKVKADLSSGQERVVKHLVQLDRELPGIAGALKNLLPTLVYGLGLMVHVGEASKGFPLMFESIASLAIYLADRMAHSFKLMLHADFLAKKDRIASFLLQKLAERPHTDRELTRRHNKLPMLWCRQALEELRAAGAVACEGNRWQLVDRPRLPSTHPPVIDVG